MLPTMQNFNVQGKKVLVRVDYNTPLKNDGSIADDARIRATLPTLKKLLEKGAKQLILMTHVGRPNGQIVDRLKTNNMAITLMKLIGKTVQKVDDCIDIAIPDTPIVLLENLRFHKEEESNDETFAKKLATHADLYINDAFSTSHRNHASMVAITKFLPGAIGLLIQKELRYLSIKEPKKPFIVILGGAKLHTKLAFIQHLLPRVDYLLLGGAMIFTFYKAKGYEIGDSLLDKENIAMAKMLQNNEKIILPTDIIIAKDPQDYKNARTVEAHQIPKDTMGLDIGPNSIQTYKKYIQNAQTIVWNGPLGYIEQQPFDIATKEIINAVAAKKPSNATTIIGGGDSIEIVDELKMQDQFTHVSTGGGASMMLLEGKELPALKAIKR